MNPEPSPLWYNPASNNILPDPILLMSANAIAHGAASHESLAFSRTKLIELAGRHREAYQNATPFPHAVIDDFMSTEALDRVLQEFPGMKGVDWMHFDDDAQKKFGQKSEDGLGAFTRLLLYQFNSAPFIEFLEHLTGIEGLIPDPHFWGGGLHQLERGGYLKLHADFTFHPLLKLNRRLNVLVYLNREWEESYGGFLELWDKDITKCEARIAPIFNRCVIFNTTDLSFHGHPEPINCPPEQTRKSIALYYYTNGRPDDEAAPTVWTDWRMTPAERESGRLKRTVSKFIPPILLDLKRAIKRKR